MVIVIPEEKAISWNKLYKQQHWSYRKREADRVHMLVRSHLDPGAELFERPVNIHIKCFYPTNVRPDSDNVCGKLYIDGLIGWVIEDDSPEYVETVSTSSFLDRENPRLEIHITPKKGE